MKSGTKNVLITVGIVVVVLFGGGYGCYKTSYNGMVAKDEAVQSAWAQVQNQYQRRMDLIPNLVNTVKGYATHEERVFTEIAEARAQAGGVVRVDGAMLDDPEQFRKYQQVQDSLGASLQRLLAVTENYPVLQANEQFVALMDNLEGTENRISVERKRYNEAVQGYNTFIREFPRSIIANMSGFRAKSYFTAAEAAQTAPSVQF
ncbi:MAG: LemA family protein [Treponemataceae bacterium]|nr:LemA family protein [Treponemataceae bacterium]